MNYKIKLNILYTILFLFGCETKENIDINESMALSSFEKIDSSISNIDFINKITPNLENKKDRTLQKSRTMQHIINKDPL